MPAPSPLLAGPGMPVAREQIEERLRSAVETDDAALTEMASHLIKAGGKRQRPLFAVAAAATVTPFSSSVGNGSSSPDGSGSPDGFGGDGLSGGDGSERGRGFPLGDAVTGGVAVELVHIGSLYHDDVIDEAATRRSVESVNARWGNLRAILAGDFLLARASELAASLGSEVAALLAATIGRLCEGEVRELDRAYQVTRTEADYLAAIRGKTASLFATACRIGGMVSRAPTSQLDALTTFGLHYGMAFQMVDDVLDVVATDAELGKPAGHDMAEGIYNLPVLRALAAGGTDADRLAGLLGGPLSPGAQAEALALVRAGPGVAAATGVARREVDRALGALAGLPQSPATTSLAEAATHLLADLADRS